jgi:hypothetical protein
MLSIKEIIGKLNQQIRYLFTQKPIYQNKDLLFIGKCQKLLDYYDGAQLDYLDKVLDSQYRADAFDLKLQKRMNNIVRYITNNLCMLFSKGILVSAANEKDADIYNTIVDSTQLEATMQILEKKTFLTKTNLIKVSYVNDAIKLDIITPEYLYIVPREDNPYLPRQISYALNLEEKTLYNPKGTYATWTDTTYKKTNESGVEINDPDNPNEENPYGVLPFVVVRDSIPTNSEFFNKLGDELINIQETLNVELTNLAYTQKIQAWGYPVITNPGKDFKMQRRVGPTVPIILVQKTKDDPTPAFEFKSPSAPLAELQKSIDRAIERACALYGIDASTFVSTGNTKSAPASQEFNSSVNEYRSQAKLVYLPIMNELFKIIRIVYNTHNSSAPLTEDGVNITILDADKGYTSVDDKIKESDYMLSKDFISLPEAMTIWMDDISEAEAEEKIIKNREINAALIVKEPVKELTIDNSNLEPTGSF